MASADDGPMSEDKRKELRKVREQLQDVDPWQVLKRMSTICNKKKVRLVFNEEDEEAILVSKNRFKRCDKFLQILQRSGDEAYDIFRQALEEVHPHLRNILPRGDSFLENPDERLLFSRIVRTNEQFSWAIREPGVWIVFTSIDVSGPKRVECLEWPDSDIRDRLEEQECLVSCAIEIRCDDSDENFKELNANLALSYDFSTVRKGQEIIMKELVNYRETGARPVWNDLETTSKKLDSSCNSCSWLGNSIFAHATINKFAVYAVVRRLKANKFSISAQQRSNEFSVQDYPEVSVIIPQPSNGLSMTIKVHELENDNGDDGIILSPIVHLKSSQEVERATITIPIALRKDQRNVKAMPLSPLQVYGYDKSQKRWDDITSKLRPGLKWVENVCSFEEVHLEKYMRLHMRIKLSEQPTGANVISPEWPVVRRVEFLAHLYQQGNDIKLVLCCFPSYVKQRAISLLKSSYHGVKMKKIFEGEAAMSDVPLSNDVDFNITLSLSHQLKCKQGEEKLGIKRNAPTLIELDVEFKEDQRQLQNLQVTFFKNKRDHEKVEELCKCSLLRCKPPQHQQKRVPSTSHGGNASNHDVPEKPTWMEEPLRTEVIAAVQSDLRNCYGELKSALHLDEDLDDIRLECGPGEEKTTHALHIWMFRKSHVTVGDLADILKNLGKQAIANRLIEEAEIMAYKDCDHEREKFKLK